MIPADKLNSLVAIHGKLDVVQHAGLEFALKAAPEAMVDRVFDLMFSGRMGGGTAGLAEAYANIAAVSVVYPETEARTALFARHRGLAIDLGMVAYQNAQAPRADVEKKEPSSSEAPKTT